MPRSLSADEAAEALDISPSTVSRDWELAQTWLYREMQRIQAGGTHPEETHSGRTNGDDSNGDGPEGIGADGDR